MAATSKSSVKFLLSFKILALYH